MDNTLRDNRLRREIRSTIINPAEGTVLIQKGDNVDSLDAKLVGQEGTPFELGVFRVRLEIPYTYPFDPPHVQFLTPIYHPNISRRGRVCLNVLNSPPVGTWSPILTLKSVLESVRKLLAEPNADDPMEEDIASQLLHDKKSYEMTAREWTLKYTQKEIKIKENRPIGIGYQLREYASSYNISHVGEATASCSDECVASPSENPSDERKE